MCTHYTQVRDGFVFILSAAPPCPIVTALCPQLFFFFFNLCIALQIVWATTNRIGCAVNVCKRMNVWGEIWENAVYLVCNYSPK